MQEKMSRIREVECIVTGELPFVSINITRTLDYEDPEQGRVYEIGTILTIGVCIFGFLWTRWEIAEGPGANCAA